jgi:hypothetical protein
LDGEKDAMTNRMILVLLLTWGLGLTIPSSVLTRADEAIQ